MTCKVWKKTKIRKKYGSQRNEKSKTMRTIKTSRVWKKKKKAVKLNGYAEYIKFENKPDGE